MMLWCMWWGNDAVVYVVGGMMVCGGLITLWGVG